VTDVAEAVEAGSDMPPARAKLLDALRAADGPQTGAQLVDRIADKHGHGLKRETVIRHLNALAGLSLVDCLDPEAAFGEAKLSTLATA
jgi:Fe2+ or Zn2+ uptake regulation protein